MASAYIPYIYPSTHPATDTLVASTTFVHVDCVCEHTRSSTALYTLSKQSRLSHAIADSARLLRVRAIQIDHALAPLSPMVRLCVSLIRTDCWALLLVLAFVDLGLSLLAAVSLAACLCDLLLLLRSADIACGQCVACSVSDGW